MKKFTINENDEGQRLSRFIEKMFCKMPKSLIYKSIRKKNVKVNSKKSIHNQILKKGDIVEVYFLDSFFEEKKEDLFLNLKNFRLDVVYEDENILVVNKEGGIKTQPNSKKNDSLIDMVIKYLTEKKEYIAEKENSFKPAFCTRLDTNTKGLVIAGKNRKALITLNELMKNGNIKKTYLCIVEGKMQKKREVLVGYWSKDHIKNKVKISKNKSMFSKKVITEYLVVEQLLKTAKLKVILHTGRSHQIRAHMALINHPIVGDFKYGSKVKENLKLLCYSLEFNTKGTYLEYLDAKKITLKDEIL